MGKARVSGLIRVKDQLSRCIACTECYGRGPHIPYADGTEAVPWVCPSLDQFKFISNTGRSQQFMARQIAFDHMKPDESVAKVFYSCPTCGICDTICPRPLADTVRAMREDIRTDYPELYPPALIEREKNITEKHNFFGATPESRNHWSAGLELKPQADTVYFAGCYGSYRQPGMSQAVVKLLRSAGEEVTTLGLEEWCCGLPAGVAGNWEIEEKMALHNVERIKGSDAKRVLFACAECYSAFKVDYPQMVGKLPFELMHVTELYDELIRQGKLHLPQEIKGKVTYQDPCRLIRQHLGRHQDVCEQPRSAIKAIPGTEFQEMELTGRFAYCCGSGAGVTSEAYPESAAWFARKRSSDAAKVADTLVTACPRCKEMLSRAARAQGLSLNVSDISELLAQSAGV